MLYYCIIFTKVTTKIYFLKTLIAWENRLPLGSNFIKMYLRKLVPLFFCYEGSCLSSGRYEIEISSLSQMSTKDGVIERVLVKCLWHGVVELLGYMPLFQVFLPYYLVYGWDIWYIWYTTDHHRSFWLYTILCN